MQSPAIDLEFAVFDEAVLLPEDRVAAFLKARCGGDIELRHRIEGLLQAHRKSVENTHDTGAPQAGELGHPERVGVYRIVETLGEGGMGVVYLAEQTKPIRRNVALKLIKPGMDSREVVARFEAERQALAMMSHRNIAKILDAGVHQGRPFFVMEHVEGVPITRFCEKQGAGLRTRLELLIAICDAVQHAHGKGIIHRDLKPTNILVYREDGEPVPKVIDFGIAKAITTPLSNATSHTTHGQILGTPAYMSPEQIAPGALGVDARTDVYALGVLLYEVLTGRPPIDQSVLAASSIDEIRRIIREVDPKRPSLAVQPGKQSERWCAELRRDLDWVVMRCMEKDPDRRYSSANEVAEDLRRYLRREPVKAGPPSGWYRARKLVQRRRVPVIAGAGVVVSLALGVVGTSIALAEAVDARNASDRQTRIANEQTEIAERHASISDAVTAFLNEGLLSAVDPGRGDSKDLTMREALDNAAGEIDGRFDEQPLTEARIRFVIGSMYDRLSEPADSEKHYRIAYRLYEERLGDTAAETTSAMDALATAIMAQARPLEARELLEEEIRRLESLDEPLPSAILRAKSQIITTYLMTEEYDTAAPHLAEVLELKREQLGDDDISTLTSMHNLCGLYLATGQFEKAVSLCRECAEGRERELGPADPRSILTMTMLAASLERGGDVEEALSIARLAADRAESSLGMLHRSTHASKLIISRCLTMMEQYGEAESILAAQIEAERESLGSLHPQTLESKGVLTGVYSAMGASEKGLPLARETLSGIVSVYGPRSTRTAIAGDHVMRHLAILGRYAEAESLGIAAANEILAAHGEGHPATTAAINAIAQLYDSWHRAEPEAGHDRRAEQWRSRIGRDEL